MYMLLLLLMLERGSPFAHLIDHLGFTTAESLRGNLASPRSLFMISRGSGRRVNNADESGFVKRLSVEKLGASTSNFLNGLKARTRESAELSYNEREDLWILLNMHVNSISTPSSYSTLVFSISQLKQQTRSWDCSNELQLLSAALPTEGALSSKDVSTLFVSFAKMQAKFDNTIGKNTLFLNSLPRLLSKMNERSVGDVIWGLGTMGATWDVLPKELQDTLLTTISIHSSTFSSYTLPSVLWSLSKMGVKWSLLPHDVREIFPVRLKVLASSMSPQQSSKAIWALGTLGASYQTFSLDTLSSHLENVARIKKSQMGSAVPASQTLTGIAKTGITWSKMSSSMKFNIWEQVKRVMQSNNERGTANAIWALGSLGTPYSDQPKPVREALFQGSSRISGTCSAWAFSNMLWGFAKMEYQWSDFPSSLKENVKANIGRLESEMNAVDVSILTWSLGSLAVPLDSSTQREVGYGRSGVDGKILGPLFDAIMRNLPHMKSQEVSRLIWGLSGTSISWDSLPQSLRWSINVALRRVSDNMSPQDVANCAYGLTLLSFDTENALDPAFRGAHDALLNKLRTCTMSVESSNIELEQLRIFAHFYDTMKIGLSNDVIRGTRVPRNFLGSDEVAYFNRNLKGSLLQSRVVDGLQRSLNNLNDLNSYDIFISPEVSSFGGIFPVDALISLNNKFHPIKTDVLAILEIDGPQHYREDGALRRKDLLKECMYLKKHPKAIFCRVRWDEANKLGVDAIGQSLACKILELAERGQKNNPLNIFDNIVSRTRRAIAWGMRNGD